jgi:hypothetical protein
MQSYPVINATRMSTDPIKELIFIVVKIEDQGDRKLLYSENWLKSKLPYYVIASPSDEVQIGDKVFYEPAGENFGWFISVNRCWN